MKHFSEVTALVYDRKLFFSVAERLSRDFAKVYYCHPDGEAFKTFAKSQLGIGHPTVEFTDDLWKVKKEVDLFVFPDCADGHLQLELESQGFPVWGSKLVGEIEELRGKWLKVCEQYGLPMPETRRVIGIDELARFLDDHQGESWFVKISRFRGDMETWEAKEPHQVENKLAWLRMRFGPASKHVLFYVQKRLETDIESGSDSYNIHGDYPDEVIIGYEQKEQSYFATIRKATEMPEEVWACSKAIQPLLKESRYANFVSSEVRVVDGNGHWLDPCFRTPSPAGEEQLEMYSNFGEIVWNGAHGELVQPKWAAKFCGEAIIKYCGDKDSWKSIVVPDEVRPFVKLYANVSVDGSFHFPPEQDFESIGCAVGLGDEPEDVVNHLREIQEALKDSAVELQIEPLADLFKEIKEAEDEGIPFSEEPVPEPATVLEDT